MDQIFNRGEAAKELKQIQIRLGIPVSNFHSIRASFITHLILKNVNIATVQELVGHSDLKTTQAYIRLCGTDLKSSTNVLDFDKPEISIAKEEHKTVLSAINDL